MAEAKKSGAGGAFIVLLLGAAAVYGIYRGVAALGWWAVLLGVVAAAGAVVALLRTERKGAGAIGLGVGVLIAWVGYSGVSDRAEQAEAAMQAKERADNEIAMKKKWAIDGVTSALTALSKAGATEPLEALEGVAKKLAERLTAARNDGAPIPDGWAAVLAPFDAADAELAKAESEAKELSETTAPEKPKFEAPAYTGTRFLQGTFRGQYDGGFLGRDGAVLQAGKKFFVVLATEVTPIQVFLSGGTLNGYVRPTGKTVTLDIGDGREAEVVEVTQRESYSDDQASYKKEVAEAKAAFKDELADYETVLASYKKALPEIKARAAALAVTIPELRSKREAALRALPAAAGSALATAGEKGAADR